MSILAKRLQKLETARHGKGRVISVRVGGHHTDKDIADLLASHDVVEGPNDLVVVLSILHLDSHCKDAPVLLGVHPMK